MQLSKMKTFLLLVVVFVILVVDLVKCFDVPGWSADKVESRIWPRSKYIFPYRIQSPVNISLARIKRRKLPHFGVHFPWHLEKDNIEIQNTGYYLEVLLPHEVEERPYITGGPLFNEKYIFEQMHFHWGQTSSCGSENLLSGKCFPAEVHVVYYNEVYGSLEEASNHPDGVAVVAFFGEHTTKDVDNPELNYLLSKLSEIVQPQSSTRSSFKNEFLFMKDILHHTSYYTFPGSLTTPPYSECVTWIICTKPFSISTRQVDAFRILRGTDGNYLRSNIRALQDFNGRPLIAPIHESHHNHNHHHH